MPTAAKKTIRAPKKEEPEKANNNEVVAIHEFFDRRSGLDVRFLWRNKGVSRYRVAWWNQDRDNIFESYFIAVYKTPDGFVVEDKTERNGNVRRNDINEIDKSKPKRKSKNTTQNKAPTKVSGDSPKRRRKRSADGDNPSSSTNTA